jgi:asparagine synthase (glutamine-hydrolysing)
VARHLGTDHTELYVTDQEAQNVIPGLAALYDEPFADSSQIPTFLLCQLARRQVTVALSGDGGDELFGGYPWYTLAPRFWGKLSPIPPPLRTMGRHLLTRFKLKDGRISKLRDFLGADGPEDLYYWLVSHWKEPTALVAGAREYLNAVTDKKLWPRLDHSVERLMYFDMAMYLSDDILVKVDRAAMGVSLETRVPLLDHRLVEFAWRLPRSWKINGGQGKWLLRRLLYRYVPQELVDRPKMGFCVPIAQWLRELPRSHCENR